MLFRKLIQIAFLSAIISGLLLGLLQSFSTTAIIHAAEQYEVVEQGHTHGDVNSHDEEVEEWAPGEGAERVGYTYLADILIAFGHSLLLTSIMIFMMLKFKKPEISWRSGFIIGIGGYLSFYVATVMGLPPEVPGTLAADLQLRQIWWSLTVIATIIGLVTLYLAPNKFKFAGILFLIMPHIIGAPQPEIATFLNENASAISALSQLEHQFLLSSAWVNLAYWLALGVFSGLFANRILELK